MMISQMVPSLMAMISFTLVTIINQSTSTDKVEMIKSLEELEIINMNN